jgi:hypothetical protein
VEERKRGPNVPMALGVVGFSLVLALGASVVALGVSVVRLEREVAELKTVNQRNRNDLSQLLHWHIRMGSDLELREIRVAQLGDRVGQLGDRVGQLEYHLDSWPDHARPGRAQVDHGRP